VALGRDRILGMGNSSFLSHSILDVLRQQHITVLAQAWRHLNQDSLLSSWINSLDLDISGDMAAEWDHFRRSLQASGVSLYDNEDKLLWIGGDSSGSLLGNNVYVALISTLNLSTLTSW